MAAGREASWAQSEPPRPGGQIRRPAGEERRDTEALDALGQVGQEAQRVAVGPLAIVHRHQHRRVVGDVHHQPVQAVQRLEPDVGARRQVLVGLEQAGRRTGPPGEQVGMPGRLADHRLQQLAHHAEDERLLEFRAGRLERQHARLPGLRPCSADQCGFADAGWPFDEQERAVSGACPAEPSAQHPQLALALQQSPETPGRDERHSPHHTRHAARRAGRAVRTDETQLAVTRPGHYLAWLSARTPAVRGASRRALSPFSAAAWDHDSGCA